uniref:Retrotransposon gag domain-containing protein n=2 Tax=Aegilops tauschii subsp. strangulata TaxID=200361 RepID=A0A453D8U5_AEGTS
MKELMLLKQTGTVEEYKHQFLHLVYTVRLYEPTISDTFLVTRFVMGLKDELRAGVEVQIPTTIQMAALYASVQEGLLLQQKTPKPPFSKNSYTKSDSKPQLATGDLWKAKQLKEYRHANGLCYKCGEKFMPGHMCNQPTVQTGQLKAAEMVDPHEIISDAVLDALVTDGHEECAAISATALSGAPRPRTIQLRALVGNQVVLILIDSGSTHSFVDQALLSRISVTTAKLPVPMQVKVANGNLVKCTECVPQLTWWLEGHSFTSPMHVFPLGGHDIILGIDWLEQWGVMQCHWAAKWIQFQYEGQEVRLQGVLPVQQDHIEEISAEQLLKWEKGNDVWATALLNRIVMEPAVEIPPAVQQILDRNKEVFQEPKTLPPHRALDHAIHLKPDAVPANCRPYRYSPLQKDEIERQVSEMLQAGLITPSISPFA